MKRTIIGLLIAGSTLVGCADKQHMKKPVGATFDIKSLSGDITAVSSLRFETAKEPVDDTGPLTAYVGHRLKLNDYTQIYDALVKDLQRIVTGKSRLDILLQGIMGTRTRGISLGNPPGPTLTYTETMPALKLTDKQRYENLVIDLKKLMNKYEGK